MHGHRRHELPHCVGTCDPSSERQRRIHATFTAGLTGSSGAILLKATSGTTTDTATILVQSQPKDKPVASLDSVWAPGRLERSLCVTVAIGTEARPMSAATCDWRSPRQQFAR